MRPERQMNREDEKDAKEDAMGNLSHLSSSLLRRFVVKMSTRNAD